MKKLGIGLLGVSGKYRQQDRATRSVLLSQLDGLAADFIDSASVYGLEDYCSVSANSLIGELVASHKLAPAIFDRLINKVGAELSHAPTDLQALIGLHESSLAELGAERLFMVMLHRPSLACLDRDSAFFDYLSRKGASQRFGISTQCPDVLAAYIGRMRVDVVQVAVNLIDFQRSLPVLKLAKAHGVEVHARSLLASGLLSGKYGVDAAEHFDDTIRSRFRQSPAALTVYKQRLMACTAVADYHQTLVGRGLYAGSLVDFCHNAILQHPLIDAAIVGGSTREQLTSNAESLRKTLPEETLAVLYGEPLASWQAPIL